MCGDLLSPYHREADLLDDDGDDGDDVVVPPIVHQLSINCHLLGSFFIITSNNNLLFFGFKYAVLFWLMQSPRENNNIIMVNPYCVLLMTGGAGFESRPCAA